MIRIKAYRRSRRFPNDMKSYDDFVFEYDVNCGSVRRGDYRQSSFPGGSYDNIRRDAMYNLKDALAIEADANRRIVEPLVRQLKGVKSEADIARLPNRQRLAKVIVSEIVIDDLIDYLDNIDSRLADAASKLPDSLLTVSFISVRAYVNAYKAETYEAISLCGVTLEGDITEYASREGEIEVLTYDEEALRQKAERLAKATGIPANRRFDALLKIYDNLAEDYALDPDMGYDYGVRVRTDEAEEGIELVLPCSQLPKIEKLDCRFFMRIDQQAFYRIGVLAALLEPSAAPAIAFLMTAYRLLGKEVDVEDLALIVAIAPAIRLVGISLPPLWQMAALAIVLLAYDARLAPILRYAAWLWKPLAVAYVIAERLRKAYRR